MRTGHISSLLVHSKLALARNKSVLELARNKLVLVLVHSKQALVLVLVHSKQVLALVQVHSMLVLVRSKLVLVHSNCSSLCDIRTNQLGWLVQG